MCSILSYGIPKIDCMKVCPAGRKSCEVIIHCALDLPHSTGIVLCSRNWASRKTVAISDISCGIQSNFDLTLIF